jgi:ATP-binding cassette subfamily C protein LapB
MVELEKTGGGHKVFEDQIRKEIHDPLAVCLEIITRMHDRPMSVTALRAGLPLVNNRLTLDLVVRAAERADLTAQVVHKKLLEISKLTLPCILILEGNQACVLVNITDNGQFEIIWPETPSSITAIARDDLQIMYTGMVVFSRPTYRYDQRAASFSEEQPKQWFWGTLINFFPIYRSVTLASILTNIFTALSPLVSMSVYDRVVPNNAFETLWTLVIGVCIIYAFDFALRQVRTYLMDSMGKSVDVLLSARIYSHVLGMRLEAMPPSAGALAHELREFEALREFFSSITLMALADVPFFLLFLGLIYWISAKIALVVALALPVIIIVTAILQWPLRKYTQNNYQDAGQRHALLMESIYGLDTIKSNSAESRMQRQWEIFVSQAAETSSHLKAAQSTIVNASLLLQNLLMVLVLVVGVYEIAAHQLTMGGLIACSILAGRAFGVIAQAIGVVSRFYAMIASLKSLDTILKKPLERPADKQFLHRPLLGGDIEFRDVSFAYPNEKVEALRGLSFTVKAGEHVGIIGRVGSGKTTIEKLLLGLYMPTKGSVLVDGIDLRQIDPADLRRNIGYVPQDVYLFYGSVRDNILFGDPDANDRDLIQAAQLAGVDEFVQNHPMGFDLSVGEGGRQLSGGQRQTIAIARALVGNPSILVFDEPTAMMDNNSELQIRERMHQYTKGKTLLLITHRLALLPLVDRLIVVERGQVILDGPRDQVMARLSQPPTASARPATPPPMAGNGASSAPVRPPGGRV